MNLPPENSFTVAAPPHKPGTMLVTVMFGKVPMWLEMNEQQARDGLRGWAEAMAKAWPNDTRLAALSQVIATTLPLLESFPHEPQGE